MPDGISGMNALKSAGLYGLTIAAGRGLSFLLLPLMTHHLVPADYGRLELLGTIADIGTMLVGLGLTDALYRRWAIAPDAESRRRVAASALAVALLVSVTTLMLGLMLTMLAGKTLEPLLPRLPLALTVSSIALDALIQVPLAWLRLTDRAVSFATLCIARTVLQGGLIITALHIDLGIAGIVGASALSALLLAIALALTQLRSTGLTIDRGEAKALLAYGLPLVLFGSFASFALGSFDRWWLVEAAGPLVIADYALASKLAVTVPLLLLPFGMWWYPRRLSVLRDTDGVRRSTTIVAAGVTCAVLAAVAVGTVGPLAIEILTPVAYHGASRWLPWLVAIMALQQIGDLMSVGCFVGRTGTLPGLITALAAVVCVAGYALLIPHYGVFGAILATLAGQTVRWFLILIASQRYAYLPYPGLRLALVTALGAAMLVAAPNVFALLPAGTLLGAGVACIVTLGAAVLLKLLPYPYLAWPTPPSARERPLTASTTTTCRQDYKRSSIASKGPGSRRVGNLFISWSAPVA
jgi:O-antigen/teichoic acid export membrane protein